MNKLTRTFIEYLHKDWDFKKNPQAGFSFVWNETKCEIWLNTHPKYHFLYIHEEDGGFTAFQTNFFQEPNHQDIRANMIITALRRGFVELAPLEFDDSIEGCRIKLFFDENNDTRFK